MLQGLKKFAKDVLPKSVVSQFRQYQSQKDIANFTSRVEKKKFYNYELNAFIADSIAEDWYKNGLELSEFDILQRKNLGPGALVFDLGAHQSLVACVLAKIVGDSGKVIAVEANEHNYQVGLKNQELNGIENLEIKHCAIAEKNGTVLFNRSLSGAMDDGSGHLGQIEVPSYTVDSLVEKYGQPDLVYMDIEGYEVHALKACQSVLNNSTDWFVEVHGPELIGRFGGTVDEVLKPFEHGYELFMGSNDQEFIPFDKNSNLLKERFFLIALSKN